MPAAAAVTVLVLAPERGEGLAETIASLQGQATGDWRAWVLRCGDGVAGGALAGLADARLREIRPALASPALPANIGPPVGDDAPEPGDPIVLLRAGETLAADAVHAALRRARPDRCAVFRLADATPPASERAPAPGGLVALHASEPSDAASCAALGAASRDAAAALSCEAAAGVAACWLAAAEARAGRDGSALVAWCASASPSASPADPDSDPHAHAYADADADAGADAHAHAHSDPDAVADAEVRLMVTALIDGLGAGARAEQLLPHWDAFWPRLRPALETLEAAWRRPGLTRRLAIRLERRLLPARLERPIALATTLAVPVDPAALEAIDPPPGLDTLLLEFVDANGALRRLERPLWGRVAAHELAALLEEELGAELLVRRGRFERHAGYRLTYRLALLRSTVRALPGRLSLDPQRRAWAGPHLPGNRHWAALQWLRRQEPAGSRLGSARAAEIVEQAAAADPGSGDATDPYRTTALRRGVRDAPQPPAGAPRPEAAAPGPETRVDATAADALLAAPPVDHPPVLAYRRIVDGAADPGDPSAGDVPAVRFEQQLTLLRRQGWQGLTLDALARHRREGRALPGRPVLLSFDGGLEAFVSQAWPRLRRHGYAGLVFLASDELPRDAAGWSRVGALAAAGVDFGWRPPAGQPADALGSEALLRSAAAAAAALRARLGACATAAAPGESCGEREWRVLASAGCEPCFQGEGRSAVWDRTRPLRRVRVRGDWDAEDFARAVRLVPDEPLVSVVVPAYNAEQTIDATLDSVRAQSHRRLEILVVDDGSRDQTVRRVERHAAADPRVRLLLQPNRGVAAARNLALQAARGAFVAPVDADDLWHPHKIERQLRTFEHGPASLGLVYTWYAVIDADGDVVRRADPSLQGHVQPDLMRLGNFVGNASSALIRRELALRFGYDPSLRERGGQGCEDFKLYLQLAAVCEFGVVPEHLTGYRVVDGNMSSAILTMRRSCELVLEEFAARQPARAALLRQGRALMLAWLAQRGLECGHLADARTIAAELAPLDAQRARSIRRRLARAAIKRRAPRWAWLRAARAVLLGPAPARLPFPVGRPV